uniref:Uncharacterized protein n=1 Tax=Nothobranchius furzeri TaxID=105023 RepID=A0A1A8U7W1_NOTFU
MRVYANTLYPQQSVMSPSGGLTSPCGEGFKNEFTQTQGTNVFSTYEEKGMTGTGSTLVNEQVH